MASPYDSAIDMFNLPRFGAGPTPFPRREDPATSARRRFLEGPSAPVQDEDVFIQERAAESPDPFGVMEEVENLRREREEEGFISDIAELSPGSTDYNQSLMGMIQKNPRIAQSKNALGLIDVQRRLAPEQKDYTNQFRDPLYRVSYQERVKKGLAPAAAYNETLNEAANEGMAINLIQAGVPVERHGQLMTGGIFDRRKVAQAIADSTRKRGYDLPLSSEDKEEFATIARDLAKAKSPSFAPTDAEKLKYMPPGKKEYTAEEWSQGWNGARAAAIQDAQERMGMFQQTFGEYFKLPEGLGAPQQQAPQSQLPAPAPNMPPDAQNVPRAAPAQTEAVVEQVSTPKTVHEELWKELEDLEFIKTANTETPQDELTPETMKMISEDSKKYNAKRKEIMDALGLPETNKGMQVFEDTMRARNRAPQIRQPGVTATGKAWKILPKKA